MKRDSSATRLQRRAAWGVFLRRPLAWFVISVFLLLILAMLLGMSAESQRRWTGRNFPSYVPRGRSVRDTEDIRHHFFSNKTDSSVTQLDFSASASIDHREGSSHLMLKRIRSGASGPQIAESVPFEEAGQLILKFPNLQWLSFRGQQLRKTSTKVLNQLPELRTIELSTSDIHVRDIEKLSQIRNLEQLKLSSISCSHNLDLLGRLPGLRSIHLSTRGMFSGDSKKQRLISPEIITSLSSLPNLSELIIETSGPLPTYLPEDFKISHTPVELDELTPAFQKLSRLRRLYVGTLSDQQSCQFFDDFSEALPGVSVRPADYERLNPSAALCVVAVGAVALLVTLHLMSCSSLPQNILLTGANSAHTRVYLTIVVGILGTVSSYAILTSCFHWLAVTSILALYAGLAVQLARQMPLGPEQISRGEQTLGGIGMGLMFGLPQLIGIFLGADVIWFLLGKQPGLALIFLSTGVFLILRSVWTCEKHYRFWAENGLPPAATLSEFQQAVSMQKQKFSKQSDTAYAASAWLRRVENSAERLRQFPSSVRNRCALWSSALFMIDPRKVAVRAAVLLPIIFLWPVLFEYFTVGSADASKMAFLANFAQMVLPMACIFIGVAWYGRYPLFQAELVRPVSRATWRTTMLTTLAAALFFVAMLVWVEVTLIRFIVGAEIKAVWLLLSVIAIPGMCVVATGAISWTVIKRNFVCSIACFVILIAAFVPLVSAFSQGAGPFGKAPAPFSDPGFWIQVIVVEYLIGALIFWTSWRKWMNVELAIE